MSQLFQIKAQKNAMKWILINMPVPRNQSNRSIHSRREIRVCKFGAVPVLLHLCKIVVCTYIMDCSADIEELRMEIEVQRRLSDQVEGRFP
ncbi:hypothetical protein C5167_015373 [Papaver somniferum]|uniref:Uncharacterized protein n=1 Tax=Papaver somniferum TaxID=3469 RepID=A0A4Y7J8Y3_PAPSO|nr:hypothetical protein C5167_015373 [Papaver somniferum]